MFTINNSMLLLNQMVKNIKGREAQGKDQQATWDAIQSLINDSEEGKEANLASSSIAMYRELLVEANSQLQLFRLPEEQFGKYEALIRQTQYKEMKKNLYAGEDP